MFCLLGVVMTDDHRGFEREAGDAVSLESPVGIMREQTDLRVGFSLLDVVDDRILRGGVTEVGSGHVVEQPESLPHGVTGLSFIDVEVRETPDSKRGKSAAIVRFVLRETGLVTLPALDFLAEDIIYLSVPQQILVGAPVRSDAMAVTLTPAKRRVYVGEPLRLDLTWNCDLEAGRLQALNYNPQFFNDPDVEVVDENGTFTQIISGRRLAFLE